MLLTLSNIIVLGILAVGAAAFLGKVVFSCFMKLMGGESL